MNDSNLIHDRERRRFVLDIGERQAFIDYQYEDGIYRLVYSEVPPDLRGQGIGRQLAERTFEAIADEGGRAVAVCSYIKLVARRSPKWRDIVDC